MNEIEESNLEKGSEENISDNVFPHLKNSVSPLAIQAENQFLALNGSDKTPPADALKPLTATERAKKHQSSKTQETKVRTPLCPLPKNASDFTRDTPAYHNKKFNSKPVAIYPYVMADNSLAFYMVRWNPFNKDDTLMLDEEGNPSKIVLPYCYVEDEKMSRYWFSCGFPEPRPLYNLPEILARPQAPVLVVEGEKVVDILKPLLPDYVITTSAHGSQSPHKSDWSAFKGRKVIICPDLDKAGVQYGDSVYIKSKEAGALSIQLLALELLVKSLMKKETIPAGYDLADAISEGLNPVLLNQSIESFLIPYLTSNEIISQKLPDGFQIDEKGSVEYWYEKKNNKGDIIEKEWRWLCGYLVITYLTRDKDNGGWAKIATLIDGDGIRKEVKITASFLSGDGNALVELLLKAGLPLNIEAKKKLIQYLNRSNPSARRRTVDKVGWYKNTYTLPYKTYGNSGGENIVLEMDGVLPAYRVSGTLAEWQENIGRYLAGNSRLLGAIGLALASPVLTPLGREGFGLHYYGHSSIGKSTTSHVGCCVYGGEFKPWRTTDNSAEGWGLLANDNILFLDEINQVSADAFYEMVYMLLNGQTKGRATRQGTPRAISTFKLNILSNGETTGEGKAKESKKNRAYNAGQTVRLIEIPADAGKAIEGKTLGVFDTLHGFKDGATLSQHLKDMSKIYCGTLGDAWLDALTKNKEYILKLIKQYMQEFIDNTPLESKTDKQVGRVLEHFALMAGCVEVAIEIGILPLEKGNGIKACQDLLNSWIGQRGGIESHEVIKFKEEVIAFLLAHGTMRFEMISKRVRESYEARTTQQGSDPIKPRTKDRMGFSKEIDRITKYYAFTETFDKELIKGRDKKILLTALADANILERDKDQFAKSERLPEFGKKRVYVLKFPQEK
jgi:putative DNA primase/helicase